MVPIVNKTNCLGQWHNNPRKTREVWPISVNKVKWATLSHKALWDPKRFSFWEHLLGCRKREVDTHSPSIRLPGDTDYRIGLMTLLGLLAPHIPCPSPALPSPMDVWREVNLQAASPRHPVFWLPDGLRRWKALVRREWEDIFLHPLLL